MMIGGAIQERAVNQAPDWIGIVAYIYQGLNITAVVKNQICEEIILLVYDF